MMNYNNWHELLLDETLEISEARSKGPILDNKIIGKQKAREKMFDDFAKMAEQMSVKHNKHMTDVLNSSYYTKKDIDETFSTKVRS